jgi:hypothetical protein
VPKVSEVLKEENDDDDPNDEVLPVSKESATRPESENDESV